MNREERGILPPCKLSPSPSRVPNPGWSVCATASRASRGAEVSIAWWSPAPRCMCSASRPADPGMTKTRIAQLWNLLMTRVLGYPRYGARGGDIGAGITSWLGIDFPENVAGIHVSDVLQPFVGPGAPPLTEAERAFVAAEARWTEADGPYAHVQRTKPQALACGLTDSPSGLAAWIVEKLRSWSDCGGEP